MTEREKIQSYKDEISRIKNKFWGRDPVASKWWGWGIFILSFLTIAILLYDFILEGDLDILGGMVGPFLLALLSGIRIFVMNRWRRRITELEMFIEESYETKTDKIIKKWQVRIESLAKQLSLMQREMNKMKMLKHGNKTQEDLVIQYEKQINIRKTLIGFYEKAQDMLEIERHGKRLEEHALEPGATHKELTEQKIELEHEKFKSESFHEVRQEILSMKENLDYTDDLNDEINIAIDELESL